MQKHHKFSIWYVMIGIWAVLILQNFIASFYAVKTISYSQFLDDLKKEQVVEVAITSNQIQGKLKGNEKNGDKETRFRTIRVDNDLSNLLDKYNVNFKGEIESTFFRDLLSWIVPAFIFVGIWFLFIKKCPVSSQVL